VGCEEVAYTIVDDQVDKDEVYEGALAYERGTPVLNHGAFPGETQLFVLSTSGLLPQNDQNTDRFTTKYGSQS